MTPHDTQALQKLERIVEKRFDKLDEKLDQHVSDSSKYILEMETRMTRAEEQQEAAKELQEERARTSREFRKNVTWILGSMCIGIALAIAEGIMDKI